DYNVVIRDDSTAVTNEHNNTTVDLSPISFAIYEIAIKSIYVATFISFSRENENDLNELAGVCGWYTAIATASGIDLPWITDEQVETGDIDSHRESYDWCVDRLAGLGLYYDLLD